MQIGVYSYGSAISRDNEGFVVVTSDGRTRVPADAVDCITMGRGINITSDALFLAIERDIPVVLTDKSGKPMGRVWSSSYGSISTIRKGQLDFTRSAEAVKWICENLGRKIENQQAMLLMLPAPDDPTEMRRQTAIKRLDTMAQKVKGVKADRVADVASQIRGWEGTASKVYFETMNLFIPEEYRFETRTQHPAMDPANALLNYAYGMLYSLIEGELIKAGADPYLGILHRDEYNRPVLVYDVIERFRVWADYVVFSLLGQRVVDDEYWSVREDGSVWLETLGRRVIIQGMNDYLAEVVDMNGVRRSRSGHVMLCAQELAQRFKSFNER